MLFKLPKFNRSVVVCETWGLGKILEEMPPEKLGGFSGLRFFFQKKMFF